MENKAGSGLKGAKSAAPTEKSKPDLQSSQVITNPTASNSHISNSLNSVADAALASQTTDPSMFADIKNQVIMEAREKRETSPKSQ